MSLLSPYQLGRLTLRNRVVMAPMTRSRALGNLANPLMARYYEQRAAAGLIVTEGIAPSPNALGYARIPGLFSAAQVESFRPVTAAVHARGGRIFAQLMHTGRIAHVQNMPAGARVLAPSALQAAGLMYTDALGPQPMAAPEAMTAADIAEAQREFADAAQRAIDAGFDGVELHAANGYLLEQFLHPHTNRRTDAYGTERQRFLLETVAATTDQIGAERVGVRISPYNTFNDLAPREDVQEEYADLARSLRGLAYLHVLQNEHPRFPATARALREAFGGTLLLNGGFDRASAEAALTSGQADLISFGRPFIANPDLVRRFEIDAKLAEPDPQTFYTPGPEGYVDYAAL